jgi:hypothetical protein
MFDNFKSGLRLEIYSYSIALLSNNLINSVTLRNLPFSQADLDRIAIARHSMVGDVPGNAASARPVCRPIGAVPAQYGHAGVTLPPEAIRKSLALLPGGK